MSEEESHRNALPPGPIVIAAFEGWSDAGEASSAAVDHLLDIWDITELATVDCDTYYDYQLNRPTFSRTDDNTSFIHWPQTSVYTATAPELDRDIIIIRGIEPSLRWRSFAAELLDHMNDAGAAMVVMLGSMFADTPHTRPLPVASTTADAALRQKLTLEPTTYEGPTGISGVVVDGARRRNMSTLSLWVSLPSYVAQGPNPKAALALLARIEDLLDISINLGGLPEEALAWENAVTELADQDTDIAQHVLELEDETATQDLPEASGDAIARDFTRYLRRRN